MDGVGHRYGKRPSELWGLNGPDSLMLSLAFDSTVLERANAYERRMMDEARDGNTEDRELRREAGKAALVKFYETLPDDSPFKARALEVAKGAQK